MSAEFWGIFITILIMLFVGLCSICIQNAEQARYCGIMEDNNYTTKMESQIMFSRVCFVKDNNKYIEYDKWRAIGD